MNSQPYLIYSCIEKGNCYVLRNRCWVIWNKILEYFNYLGCSDITYLLLFDLIKCCLLLLMLHTEMVCFLKLVFQGNMCKLLGCLLHWKWCRVIFFGKKPWYTHVLRAPLLHYIFSVQLC